MQNQVGLRQHHFSSVQFSHSVVSNSLWPHEPQHTRPPCPSQTLRVHPNPCPLSWWWRGKPGVLQSMGLQRVGHQWVTELNSVYSCHLFLIPSASIRSIPFLSFIEPIFAWNVPSVSLIFLKRSLVFPILLFSSISLRWSPRKAFLSLLAILWNSAFRLYLSFSPLLLASLLFRREYWLHAYSLLFKEYVSSC